MTLQVLQTHMNKQTTLHKHPKLLAEGDEGEYIVGS